MKVGIIGAGQLSRMLVESGISLGLEMFVYANSPFEPASKISKNVIIGTLNDFDLIKNFFLSCDLVTIENEFLPTDLLKKIELETGVRVYPNLNSLEILQDKIEQKNILKKLNIPTSDFSVYQFSENWKNESHSSYFRKWCDIQKSRRGHCFLKWSRFGYDGKGVFEPHSPQDPRLLNFFEEASLKGSAIYAEDRIEFKSELAMVSVRRNCPTPFYDDFKNYPLSYTKQLNSICDEVWGPANQWKLPVQLEKKAAHWMEELGNYLNFHGAFAFEFFLTKSNRVFVNEIAPRVHNSGHFTQSACISSQFENHLRAVCGFPLSSTESLGFYWMKNLVSESDTQVLPEKIQIPTSCKFVTYGKESCRKGRKMGHINIVYSKKISGNKLKSNIYRWLEDWRLARK